MKTDNLINLAKKGVNSKMPAPVIMKKEVIKKKPILKKLTLDEERNLKAKLRVEKLLEDSPITTLDKRIESIKIEEPDEVVSKLVEPKGIEWLEEQVSLLSEKNGAIASELELVKSDYERLYQDYQNISKNGVNSGAERNSIFALFNELQENFINMGVDTESGIPNFRVRFPAFLNRMVKFFPFLESIKKY